MSKATASNRTHEVDFAKWCPLCQWADLDPDTPDNDICNRCLTKPYNIDSRKPVHWVQGGEDDGITR